MACSAPVTAQPIDPSACLATLRTERDAHVRRSPDFAGRFINLRAPEGWHACEDCDEVRGRLSNWAGFQISDVSRVQSAYPRGCVGMRKDLGASEQGAACLAQFLGPRYFVSTREKFCGADGFPYTVVPAGVAFQ